MLAFLCALLIPTAAFAQAGPSLQPDSLTFSLQTGDTLTRYATLTTPVLLTDVTVERQWLVNDENNASIPPDKVVLSDSARREYLSANRAWP